MSKIKSYLEISPKHVITSNSSRTERFVSQDFPCPACNGFGYHDSGGWARKLKASIHDPDIQDCPKCEGTGKLSAEISINWVASKKTKK